MIRVLLVLGVRHPDLVSRARKMSDSGVSITKIGQIMKVNSTKISRWVNNIEKSQRSISGKRGIITNRRAERIEAFNKDLVPSVRLKAADARLLASIFYWCEGAKYPSTSTVSFTSSDVEMQKLFIFLFRKAFTPEESKFKVWLQLHTTHNVNDMFNFWSKTLQVPVNQFYNPHITEKKGGRYRENYLGTCSLRYQDYRIQLRMMGLYTRFSRKLFQMNNLI